MKVEGPGPVPKDALDYFRNKVSVPGFDYRDIWKDEHANAFTVAKAMQVDILETLRGAVDKALAEGRTLRDFAKDLTPELQRLGWWGKADMVDPKTGETVNAQLGSPRRLKTIYNTNMRTARAAGQWERAERTKKALPYMLYELGPSREHRVDHVGWHGTCLSIDDPWWDEHMPPNGWGCKCRVRQVSRVEYERLKKNGVQAPDRTQEINPETGLPTGRRVKRTVPMKTTAPKTEYVEWENKRKGRVELVPAGIDPGWDTNPGKVRQQNLENLLAGKIDGLKTDVERTVVMRDLASSGRFERWVDGVTERNFSKGETFIIGVIDDTVRGYVEAKGVRMNTQAIMINDERLLHSRDRKGPRALPIEDVKNIPLALLDAECLWDTEKESILYAFPSSVKGKVDKVVVRINYIKKGNVSNMVVTTGIVQPENLTGKRYVRIK